MKNINILKSLYISFFKVGIMTFGGGYAMIPILDRELCENKGWVSNEELMDYYALSQCTPGIIAVNTATFIGYKLAGDMGGIIATLGVISPSVVIITLIASLITSYSEVPFVQYAFGGIRVCVCVLILNSVIKLFKKSVKDKVSLIIFLVIILLSLIFNISPVIFVIFSAIVGLIIHFDLFKSNL